MCGSIRRTLGSTPTTACCCEARMMPLRESVEFSAPSNVIPAQAGIHATGVEARPGLAWMPASAGMTDAACWKYQNMCRARVMPLGESVEFSAPSNVNPAQAGIHATSVEAMPGLAWIRAAIARLSGSPVLDDVCRHGGACCCPSPRPSPRLTHVWERWRRRGEGELALLPMRDFAPRATCAPVSPLPVLHGERVRVRGRSACPDRSFWSAKAESSLQNAPASQTALLPSAGTADAATCKHQNMCRTS